MAEGRPILGGAKGNVRLMLRLEGLLVLLAASYAYSKLGFGWGTFALYFLIPDLGILGYFIGPKAGAITYNTCHTYLGAIPCVALGYFLAEPALLCAGIIWVAHIGFDRSIGVGLKYSNGFGFTHLGFMKPAHLLEKPAPASTIPS